LLPPSAFDTLARLQVDYPMLFRLTSSTDNKSTHCGVLEFTAEEGTCYIPFWMMQNLLIEEGAVITVSNVSLPKASFVKLQPQSVDFLEISNPRAVLEHALRNFSVVTKGDIIQIPYNNKNYHFELKEVKPQDAACIIETDCNVDFDAPVGYVEPDYAANASASNGSMPKDQIGERSSACPSPTTLSTTSTATNMEEDSKPQGTRIVNGQILRPDEEEPQPTTTMLADRAGSTGVQNNAAIPVAAPEVDYWAVAAGDGARLDGKAPASLKDKEGNELNIRKLRAEAAARRAEAASNSQISGTGKTLTGEAAPEQPSAPSAPTSKRKTKVGSKYSRLKTSGVAFKGSANSFRK
jgi:ubiquitin fusion degradation protein 1